ncbi:MAG: hypothetical protein CR989_01030 [Flavobacteriales bacterium]|nr:MAG: hypothetical protein CR989_01030 [Flavobacteriales bacterium]
MQFFTINLQRLNKKFPKFLYFTLKNSYSELCLRTVGTQNSQNRIITLQAFINLNSVIIMSLTLKI